MRVRLEQLVRSAPVGSREPALRRRDVAKVAQPIIVQQQSADRGLPTRRGDLGRRRRVAGGSIEHLSGQVSRAPAKSPQAKPQPSSKTYDRCVDAIQRCVSHAGLHESIASMGAASSKSSRESTRWSCIGANPFAALFAEVPKADVSETKPPAPEADECSD